VSWWLAERPQAERLVTPSNRMLDDDKIAWVSAASGPPATPVVRDPSPSATSEEPRKTRPLKCPRGGPKRSGAEPGSPADNGRGRKNAVTSPLKDL
jgi:hypothetical protein